MVELNINLNDLLVVIPVSDVDLFYDYDSYRGYNGDFVCLTNSIVVTKEREKSVRELVAQFEQFEQKEIAALGE